MWFWRWVVLSGGGWFYLFLEVGELAAAEQDADHVLLEVDVSLGQRSVPGRPRAKPRPRVVPPLPVSRPGRLLQWRHLVQDQLPEHLQKEQGAR